MHLRWISCHLVFSLDCLKLNPRVNHAHLLQAAGTPLWSFLFEHTSFQSCQWCRIYLYQLYLSHTIFKRYEHLLRPIIQLHLYWKTSRCFSHRYWQSYLNWTRQRESKYSSLYIWKDHIPRSPDFCMMRLDLTRFQSQHCSPTQSRRNWYILSGYWLQFKSAGRIGRRSESCFTF